MPRVRQGWRQSTAVEGTDGKKGRLCEVGGGRLHCRAGSFGGLPHSAVPEAGDGRQARGQQLGRRAIHLFGAGAEAAQPGRALPQQLLGISQAQLVAAVRKAQRAGGGSKPPAPPAARPPPSSPLTTSRRFGSNEAPPPPPPASGAAAEPPCEARPEPPSGAVVKVSARCTGRQRPRARSAAPPTCAGRWGAGRQGAAWATARAALPHGLLPSQQLHTAIKG